MRNWIYRTGILMVLAASLWTACSTYQPASEGYIQSAPNEASAATAEKRPLEVPPLNPAIAPSESGDTSELDLPSNPAIWGESAERAVGRKFSPIYFDFDSPELRPAARRALDEYAAWLGKNPEVWVTLEGHCDSAGSNEYNYSLGMQRALEVKTHLAYAGTTQDRLFVISYGEEHPAIAESTPEEAALNRRVEFRAFRAPAGHTAPPMTASPAAAPETKEPETPQAEASDLP